MTDEIIDADVVEDDEPIESLQAAFDAAIAGGQGGVTQLPPPPEDVEVQNPPSVEAITTEAAFVVYMLPDGRWVANSEAVNRPIATARQANFNDMIAACAVIAKDITVAETAQATVLHQRQAAAQLAQTMAAQKMFDEVSGKAPMGGVDLQKMAQQAQMNRQQRRNQ